ncbi:hypothetical protein Q7O_001160 [Pectobacterium carotovorum subsp. carotovorum PCCS1]|nr:hypothetical protein [Pectobacterium carotovorum subsp. carotovorum PCCS1]
MCTAGEGIEISPDFSQIDSRFHRHNTPTPSPIILAASTRFE